MRESQMHHDWPRWPWIAVGLAACALAWSLQSTRALDQAPPTKLPYTSPPMAQGVEIKKPPTPASGGGEVQPRAAPAASAGDGQASAGGLAPARTDTTDVREYAVPTPARTPVATAAPEDDGGDAGDIAAAAVMGELASAEQRPERTMARPVKAQPVPPLSERELQDARYRSPLETAAADEGSERDE